MNDIYEKLFVALGQKYGKPANTRDEIIALFNHLAVQGDTIRLQAEELEKLNKELTKTRDKYKESNRNVGLLKGLVVDMIGAKSKLSRVAIKRIRGYLDKLEIKVVRNKGKEDLKFPAKVPDLH